MEYIKKLQACIKWLLEREDANLIEIGNISARLEAEGKEHSETGTKPELDPIIESDFLAQVQPNTWSGRVMLGKAQFFAFTISRSGQVLFRCKKSCALPNFYRGL